MPNKCVRLLTIGNSFANNALTWLEDLAAGGDAGEFIVGRANLGGCSLEKHWNLACYTQEHPEFKTYDLCKDKEGAVVQANLQEALVYEPWDVITLQQVSRKSWLCDTFNPYLDNLLQLIRERAPQARVWLHQTWAYRSDSPYYAQNGLTPELMHQRIRESYDFHSQRTGCPVLFSGEAVYRVRNTEGWQFTWPDPNFDYQHAQPPTLPDQSTSLAVGWYWNIKGTENGIPRLQQDPNHLNERGCYLIGCVWYESLLNDDVRPNRFVPPGMDPQEASFLRRIAHEVVKDNLRQ